MPIDAIKAAGKGSSSCKWMRGGAISRAARRFQEAAVQARRVDVIVVYKVDRLTRSLADFAKLVELFD